MKRIARFFAVVLFGVFCVGISGMAEEITLTTYYPAPYGAYEDLDVSDDLTVGDDATISGILRLREERTDLDATSGFHWFWAGGIQALAVKSDGNIDVQGDINGYKALIINGVTYLHGRVFTDGLLIGAGNKLFINPDSLELVMSSSSSRYKHDIRDYDFEISKVNELRPVRFKWNEDTTSPNKEDFGLIAEEVYEVFPELVTVMDGQPQSVSYEKIGVILLKHIQELNRKVKDLEEELGRIKKSAPGAEEI